LRQVCLVSRDNLFFFLAAASISGFFGNFFHAVRQAPMILTTLSRHCGAGAAIRDAAAYGRRDREGFVTNSNGGLMTEGFELEAQL
jgi:hypothetical protein